MANSEVAGGWCGRVAEGKPDADRSRVEQPGVRGIILAGVHTWGHCLLEAVVARPLLPVAARPLIWHILRWIRDGGILETTVCGNSDTTSLRRSLGNGESLNVSLAYSEDLMPRGPAGCARDAALNSRAETFLVVDGTILPRIDLAALLAAHTLSKATVTIVVAGANGADGQSEDVQEPAGIYVFSRAVLEKVPATGYQDIKEALIPNLYRRGQRIATHLVPGNPTLRVTDAASYRALNMWAVQQLAQDAAVPEGYVSVGEAWIDPSARVAPTARFVGPALVGPKCVIEAGAMIVGPATIGEECTIGPGAVVSRSAVWDRCRIGAGALLDHCILTDEAIVEPEVVTRSRVRTPPHRSTRTLLDRLASYCWPARDGARVVKGDSPPTKPGHAPGAEWNPVMPPSVGPQ